MCHFFFIVVCFESLCHCCVVNMPATLHSFLNVCTWWHPLTIMTVLSVYLTCLAALNVYCTYVLQYSFVPFFLWYCLQWNCVKLFSTDITGSMVDACSLVRSMLLVLVWFNFAKLRSCSCSWTSLWLFTGLLFFNFASYWTCCCGLQVLGLSSCHPSLTGRFTFHRFVAIPFFLLGVLHLADKLFQW